MSRQSRTRRPVRLGGPPEITERAIRQPERAGTINGRTRWVRVLLCGLTALAAAAPVRSPALAHTYHVDPQGRGDAATIQGAITMASPRDTILLANGAYRGAGNRDIAFHGKPFTLGSISGNPDSCRIDCESQGRGFLIDSLRIQDSPHIDGITVMNGRAATGGAVYCAQHCSPLFSNCVFRGNRADEDGGAIRCAGITEVAHFMNCVFSGNSAGGRGGAVALCCCSLSRFENCTVVDNEAREGSAFSCVGLSNLRLNRSIIAFQRGAAAIRIGCGEGSCDAEIDSCDVFGNEGGNWVACLDSLARMSGNVFVDPGFEDVQAHDFRLRETSPLRPAARSGRGIGAGRAGG